MLPAHAGASLTLLHFSLFRAWPLTDKVTVQIICPIPVAERDGCVTCVYLRAHQVQNPTRVRIHGSAAGVIHMCGPQQRLRGALSPPN
jgi:hypothetical protein